MSLQGKIEAVIYASEEPVTLPQLIGLLGEEAQAELDALDAQQTSLSLGLEDLDDRLDDPVGEASGDEDALNAELLDNPELDEAEPASGTVEQAAAAPKPQGDPVAQEAEDPADQTSPAGLEGAQEAAPEGESEAKAASAESATPSPGAAEATDVEAPPKAQVPEAEPGAPPSADEKKQARERERRLREYFRSLLDRLIADYANSDRGLEIREVAGGFRLATKPEYHDAVRGFVKSLKPPLKLSLQALETLAVIAYKQPVTAPEISEIRGVESGGVLGTLMARKLIGTAGRKAVIGRPMLYKTTKEFLVRFGLKDINELPSIEEFEKMAGELNEPVQEEIPMSEDAAAETHIVAEGRTSVELVSGDGSPVLNELNTAPGSTSVHENPEEMMSDKASSPAGTDTEPSSGASAEAACAVEQSAGIHEAQADGDSTPTAEAQENPADDAIVDGRLSGIPPRADADEVDNPSAQEAAVQAEETGD